jgi:hypothetical protein
MAPSILKFYLHISPEEQLKRFLQRLDDPSRQWKISESDYSDRMLWPKYIKAYEDAISLTSTKYAPWFVIPSNHKWFRNLALSEILSERAAGASGIETKPAGTFLLPLAAPWQKCFTIEPAVLWNLTIFLEAIVKQFAFNINYL